MEHIGLRELNFPAPKYMDIVKDYDEKSTPLSVLARAAGKNHYFIRKSTWPLFKETQTPSPQKVARSDVEHDFLEGE